MRQLSFCSHPTVEANSNAFCLMCTDIYGRDKAVLEQQGGGGVLMARGCTWLLRFAGERWRRPVGRALGTTSRDLGCKGDLYGLKNQSEVTSGWQPAKIYKCAGIYSPNVKKSGKFTHFVLERIYSFAMLGTISNTAGTPTSHTTCQTRSLATRPCTQSTSEIPPPFHWKLRPGFN